MPAYGQPARTDTVITTGPDSVKSAPPDRTIYPGSGPRRAPSQRALPAGFLLTDATASASSTGGNEPSIAVNPANPNQIVITRFNNKWNSGAADLLYSTDAGHTWTEENTIPTPPGIGGTALCPCDQTVDYGRDGTLYGTFLTFDPNTNAAQVVSGSTANPASAAAWQWRGNPAQLTSGNRTNADQPWLLVNRDPTTASQDNVYVAYDDFAGSPDARVAASYGAQPPNFTVDNKAGTENPLATNPGLRLATDPSNGTIYALYEQSTGATQPKTVTYKLNRSTDGGATWTLNGNPDGLTVDTVPSDQAPGYKFGTVNALLGGVDHAAVDPTNGDVYVVYGQDVAGGNQIKIRRLTSNGSGGLNVGPATNVSTATNAALPSVAVSTDGSIGVLYDTYDGNTQAGFPIFTAHFARSTDHGATFNDTALQSFQSPVTDNGDPRQRILGDYQQLKAVGTTFYGTFPGNTSGVPAAGTPPIDAMFVSFRPLATNVSVNGSPNPAAPNQAVTLTATVTCTGGGAGEPAGTVQFFDGG
ncbi:Ig-like domain-containing protein, partial [Gandjariella thermophila]|uniref:Ig-like domain-containing protein n=1 Tax=Gandjariella thermophila TaxID=1931992 RepID=UPI0010FA111E